MVNLSIVNKTLKFSVQTHAKLALRYVLEVLSNEKY